jgi:hypothetical protein
MKSVRLIVIVSAALAMSSLGAGFAHARPAVDEAGHLSGSFPTGDWGQVAGFGLGVESAATVYPDSSKSFGIRQGSSFIYNFRRSADVPSANLDSNTSLHTDTANTSLWFGIGPALTKHSGNLRPFVYGTAGFAINWIDSHLKGDVQGAKYDATVGQTSTTFVWTAGAGFSKPMSSLPGGRIEFSAEYRSGINQNYLVPGEVASSGSNVSWDRSEHKADQIIVRLGILNCY